MTLISIFPSFYKKPLTSILRQAFSCLRIQTSTVNIASMKKKTGWLLSAVLSISVIFVYPGNMIYSDWTDPLTLSLCLMTLPFFNSSIAASPMEGNPWPHQVLLFLGITPV